MDALLEINNENSVSANTLEDHNYTVAAEFNVAEVLKVMASMKGVIEKKSTIPILSNVLINFNNFSQAEFVASDMDLMAKEVVKCDVTAKISGNSKVSVSDLQQVGVITIPAITFYDILRSLDKDSKVKVTKIHKKHQNEYKTTIEVTSDSFSINIPYMSADNFPFVNLEEFDTEFSLDASLLKNVFKKIKFAISTDETKFFLNGIYLHLKNSDEGERNLCFVSTDLHRLAISEIPLEENINNFHPIILPHKAVNELSKLLENYVGLINIKLSNTKAGFSFADATLVTKLIDGQYPEYGNAVVKSDNCAVKATVNKAKLEKSVSLVSIVAPKTNSVCFSFKLKNQVEIGDSNSSTGILNISTRSENNSNAKQEMFIDYSATEDLDINFNAKYVLDILSVVDNDSVELYLNDSTSALLVKDSKDTESTFILMPTRG